MLWAPTSEANDWLQRILFTVLQRRQTTDRVLAHLTIKGNFIFARDNRQLTLDADGFGRPRGADQLHLDLPTGDQRRGGDLDMWFWLTPVEGPPTGLNLVATVLPGPVGALGGIRGTLTDNAGAATPGVSITVTGPVGTRVATTDAQGAFTFPNLPRGTYRVSVQVGALSAEQTVIIS